MIDGKQYNELYYFNHKEVVEYLGLILISPDIKNLIQEYKKTKSTDVLAVIQDYFFENNLFANSIYSNLILDVIEYFEFK